MKVRLFALFVLSMCVVLLTTWTVSAQGPKPTTPPARGGSPDSTADQFMPQMNAGTQNWDESKLGGGIVLRPTGALLSRANPRIATGQVGTVFRYLQTFGTTGEAYPPSDVWHLDAPWGLFIDGSNNVYVTEVRGVRVLGYDPAGTTNIFHVGVSGWCVGTNTTPIGLCVPQDIAKDGSGNVWVADGGNRVVEFNASGNYMQQLPPSNAWYNGTDNTHFSYVTGIAFDNTAGRMFVTDSNNHRVQVYTFSGGNPVYDSTIGQTGFSGNDSNHLNYPRHVAVDSLGRVYIADTNNNRVQRCTYGTPWSCITIDSGLNQPEGVAVDSSFNTYIADTRNARIRKCTSAPSCSNFINNLPSWVDDVAMDSGGNIYVNDTNGYVVWKYNSSGTNPSVFVGTLNTPYTTNNVDINMPWGIAIASDNSIYVAENNGVRLIKLNAAGSQLWTVGTAGVWGGWGFGDNTHFSGPQGVAVDSAGRIYVADSGNNRIQTYNADSSFYKTFGSYGNGPMQLNCPSSIAFSPLNGDVYIADRCNHRVQVYDSSLTTNKATLGWTSVSGSDSSHFNNPYGVAVDASGNVYVADTNNHRIQKCTVSGSGGTCTTWIGQTGSWGNDLGRLNSPQAVALDSANRLYVVDRNNNRVQVFDASGAYLTTIGGSWGSNTGQLRGPNGIALDSTGNVYVTDRTNSRIQKYAPGVPGWQQANLNGFGDKTNATICSLNTFGGQLYAGTNNSGVNGGQLWRKGVGGTWTSVTMNGFGDASNYIIEHLAEFNGNLYATTGSWDYVNNKQLIGQIWRSGDGATWNRMTVSGLDSTNGDLPRLAVFNNKIYVSTWSYTTTHGAEIWRSDTGDSSTWSQVVANGFGNNYSSGIPTLQVFNSYLYAAVSNLNTTVSPNTSIGGQVWRTSDGTTWSQVNANGFGSTDNYAVRSFSVFNNQLYAGVTSYNYASGTSTGAKIYRCTICDGSDWTAVVSNGFGDANHRNVNTMLTFNNTLYATTSNPVTGTGLEIWQTTDGTTWKQVNPDGFGTSNNTGTCYNNSLTVFNNNLYIGTANYNNGGQIWQLLNQLHLSLILR